MIGPGPKGIVVLLCAAALAAPGPNAFAQAGSTGGSVGKTDKSVSGGSSAGGMPAGGMPVDGMPVDGGRGARPGYVYPVGLDPNGDNWLALRSEPGGRGVRLRKMGPDTLMTVLSREGGWSLVRLATGETGWASSRYLACCR